MNRKLIRFFASLFLIPYSVVIIAQTTTISPYSRYGLGLLQSEVTNQNFGLAGTNAGLRSSSNINPFNPASYSELTITTLEFGGANNAMQLSDGAQKQFQNSFYFNHIAFGFPVIKDKWGMAFGAMPYTHVGYDYHTLKNDTNAGGVSYYYVGEGGTTKVFFGNALKFKIDSTSLISFGYNLEFLFGNIYTDKKVIYSGISSAFNLWSITNNHVADFNSAAGIQYKKTFTNSKSEKYILTVGTTYSFPANLRSKKSETIRTFTGNLDFGTLKDTISTYTDKIGSTPLPSKISGGFTFAKENKWMFGLDIKTINWSTFSATESNVTFNDNLSVSACYEFTPDHTSFKNYFKRIKYQFGARYSTAYLSINNEYVNEYGITFGLGLPIKRTDTSLPSLTLGAEYGKRGVAKNGLLEETFFNAYIGITINDRWFIKRKYN